MNYKISRTLTWYKNKQHETGCVPLGATECETYPPLTAKEIVLGLTENDIVWDCTDGKKGGSHCTKSCAAGDSFLDWSKSSDQYTFNLQVGEIYSNAITKFIKVRLFWSRMYVGIFGAFGVRTLAWFGNIGGKSIQAKGMPYWL